jgi:hypothetical protein
MHGQNSTPKLKMKFIFKNRKLLQIPISEQTSGAMLALAGAITLLAGNPPKQGEI